MTSHIGPIRAIVNAIGAGDLPSPDHILLTRHHLSVTEMLTYAEQLGAPIRIRIPGRNDTHQPYAVIKASTDAAVTGIVISYDLFSGGTMSNEDAATYATWNATLSEPVE